MNGAAIAKSHKVLIDEIHRIGIEIVDIKGDEVCCRCPKHDDSSPSFFFNLKSEAYQCFAGCMKGRGIHQLIFQVTGVSMKGLPAENISSSRFAENRRRDRQIIPTIPMLPIALNNRGQDYLLKRGFHTDTIADWSIRFWEERNAIVIPIEDKGYALRFLETPKEGPDKGKKYKYIVGTKIGDTLFGLSKIKKTLTNIILVEGSLDAIYMHQLGYENTLALLHADISTKQLQILGGITDYVYIMLDGDPVGREASQKIKRLLNHRFIKKICYLPDGKDPDNLTKEEIEQIIENSK